ncbi:hypothetical protein [Enteractinococcus helveticum]|uniref:Uncharacterized protein n=1 Tax=Enteractinococcus helveticum TaxID=1837282 RepID=A0A1B7M2L3_9MICC|nr:hypothetical protein [Enteractinococcus helveticum]OAV62800.1 hypothetical protein A6F49_04650 [Enteractinococcus helveticum]
MTHHFSSDAASRRESSRQTDGKFGHQHHSEAAEVNLAASRQFTPEDHIELGERLSESLQEFSQDIEQSWVVDHNEDSQVSYVHEVDAPDRSHEREEYDYEDTNLVFSIGAENHLSNGKINIDCESPSDGHDLAGPYATELEENGWLVSEHRSSYEADSMDDAIDWAKDKVRSRRLNDAYVARHDDRAQVLDDLARTENIEVLSAVNHDAQTSDAIGSFAKSEHLENYQEAPVEVLENATSIYSNMQQHHYGVGASLADELRSAYIVSAYDDEGQQKWLVSHAYGVHSETEAEEGYRNVAVLDDHDDARKMAQDHSRLELEGGSIAASYKDLNDIFSSRQQGHVMAIDTNHTDGMIVLRKPHELDPDRHRSSTATVF